MASKKCTDGAPHAKRPKATHQFNMQQQYRMDWNHIEREVKQKIPGVSTVRGFGTSIVVTGANLAAVCSAEPTIRHTIRNNLLTVSDQGAIKPSAEDAPYDIVGLIKLPTSHCHQPKQVCKHASATTLIWSDAKCKSQLHSRSTLGQFCSKATMWLQLHRMILANCWHSFCQH